ncbi:MAG: sulfotransferase family 2 domain-containing protein [Paracoccaceae bacterium]
MLTRLLRRLGLIAAKAPKPSRTSGPRKGAARKAGAGAQDDGDVARSSGRAGRRAAAGDGPGRNRGAGRRRAGSGQGPKRRRRAKAEREEPLAGDAPLKGAAAKRADAAEGGGGGKGGGGGRKGRGAPRKAGDRDVDSVYLDKAERRRKRRAAKDGPPPFPTPPDPKGRPVVHLMHIRKTAGTALKEALDPIRRAGTETCAIRPCPHRFTLADLPPGEKLVAVLRDPIDRYVSGFFSRLREGRPRYHNPWNKAERACFERFTTPDALARALRAEDAGTREAAEAAMRGVNHVRTSLWDWFVDEETLRARAPDILLLMRQERLAEDFSRLLERLGAPDTLRLPEDETRAHANRYDDDARLSPEAVEILKDWYARDYALLAFAEAELGLAPLEGPTGWQKRLAAAS